MTVSFTHSAAAGSLNVNGGRTAARPPMDTHMDDTRKCTAAQLLQMINNPPDGSVTMLITPDLAAEMLKYNDRNRPLSEAHARTIAKDILAGRWSYTRQNIIFSDAGRLNDGQHRLRACVLSGTPIKSDVVFGSPDDSFPNIDNGRKRTASDVFSINGVKESSIIAASMAWVHMYNNKTIFSNGGGIRSAELYDLYLENVGIHESVKYGRKFQKSGIAPSSLMTALHYICSKKSKSKADEFFTLSGDGFGAKSKFDPALVLRNKLVEAAANREKLHRTIVAGLSITAWNLSRLDRTGRGLRFDPTAPFPRVR